MHNRVKEQEKLLDFLKAQVTAGKDIHSAIRAAWVELGSGLMDLKHAVQLFQCVESREAAGLVARATFEIPRAADTSKPSEVPRLK
ncbi:hypothetical protein E7T09_13195 [Deinococcus sp. KSM4-11]|uniref:hypothetical protein n=1 Tax=Deinococcus sp. KSM4-11 TaxID=2568654 RepID=UPI0010A4E4ED|nr:hypothetical protein [Deinococcus sp. KSM4-11]THF86171.1 hypothetical protein E7T09_13195 [Deinococcus sp. KSM4-11]